MWYVWGYLQDVRGSLGCGVLGFWVGLGGVGPRYSEGLFGTWLWHIGDVVRAASLQESGICFWGVEVYWLGVGGTVFYEGNLLTQM